MVIDSTNIGNELKRWFEKSIYNYHKINFCDNSVFESSLNIFIHDYKRYYLNQNLIVLDDLLKRHELIGILLYRLSRNYFLQGNEQIATLYSNLGTFLSGFEIYYSSEIGKGLKINHGIGTVVGARSIIGENVLLHHGVTLGDKNAGRPKLEDNVIVYPGAKILGGILIGENSVVGANTVCMINVPANSIIVGNPAKILKK